MADGKSQTTDWRETVVAAVADVLLAVKQNDPSMALVYLGGAVAAARIAELGRSA